MDVAAGPGPDREAVVLQKWEADAFLMLIEASTHAEARFHISFALKNLRYKPAPGIIDAFERNARLRLWKD